MTLTGLNRLLEALIRLGVSSPATPAAEPIDTIGIPYQEQTGGVEAEPAILLQNWDALDESSRAHMTLQNSLAAYVRSVGVVPRSPNTPEPAFDIAWEHEGTTVIVEVKSANDSNHRQQARLGIGQVLEYVAILNDAIPGDYRPVLLLGQTPSNVDYLLAAISGVVVIGADQFTELGLEDLLPLSLSSE